MNSMSDRAGPRRVVVTGLGVIAPNAYGLVDFAKALYDGRSGIRFVPELQELGFSCQVGGIPASVEDRLLNYFDEGDLLALNESMKYSCLAAIDAFRDAGLEVRARDDDRVYEDTGAIIGTGIGGLDTFANKVYPQVSQGKVRRLGSTIVEQVMASAVSAKLAGILALGNQVTTNSAACSTGTEATIMAAERIRAGFANRMLAGGAEGSSPYIWAGFDSMRVLNRTSNDHPEKASRPMSASAKGFIPGSGAGVVILEELQTALNRGAKIYGEVLGYALNSGGMRNGGSMTAPSAKGVQSCIRMALQTDKGLVRPDYINGHLTATFADPYELGNWSKALEVEPKDLPLINSTKSMIGHALGAAGAIECVATLLQLDQGFVHGSINCEDLHPEIVPYEASVVRQSRKVELEVVAKASFGFGDVNSCIVFKKWRNGHV